jgi:hypothetical protein
MSDLEIRIPSSLGLSEEQQEKLEQAFRNQVADIVKGSQAAATAVAKPQAVSVPEVITIRKIKIIDA